MQETSKAHEHIALLDAGVEGLPEDKGVQTGLELLSQGHDDVQVTLGRQVQVRLQAAQRAKRLFPLLPAEGRRADLSECLLPASERPLSYTQG